MMRQRLATVTMLLALVVGACTSGSADLNAPSAASSSPTETASPEATEPATPQTLTTRPEPPRPTVTGQPTDVRPATCDVDTPFSFPSGETYEHLNASDQRICLDLTLDATTLPTGGLTTGQVYVYNDADERLEIPLRCNAASRFLITSVFAGLYAGGKYAGGTLSSPQG